MVLVTLGALLTPVQWKRSILGVPSATLHAPASCFISPSFSSMQAIRTCFFMFFTQRGRELSYHGHLLGRQGPGYPICMLGWDGTGHGLEGGEQEFT